MNDVRRPMPEEGEVFGLTLNPVIAPLDMVRNDGYDPTGWSHKGSVITEPQTARFKFISVGCQSRLDAVIRALRSHGTIPPGQYMEAVKATFKPDGIHPVGIADPSWRAPGGYANFPCMSKHGYSNFSWAGDRRDGFWLWLVQDI